MIFSFSVAKTHLAKSTFINCSKSQELRDRVSSDSSKVSDTLSS